MIEIPKATDGPLAGFATLNINTSKLLTYLRACKDRAIGYGFGDKDPKLGVFPPDYKLIDCSGFVRTALFYATDGESGKYNFPDGSCNQHAWFEQGGFKGTEYGECSNIDQHVRVGVHAPQGRGGDAIGHIWLVYEGATIESYGGNGPGSHAWNSTWYPESVDACYVLS